MSDFKINLGAITNGENQCSFEIKDSFFEAYTLSDVEHADITATALLEKNSEKLTLNLSIDGQINKLLCDICTEELSIDISAGTKVIIKKTDEDLISTDEIFYININENTIDLKQLIFELIVLNVPKKRQHLLDNKRNSTCNKEMVDLVNKYTEEKEKTSDPRWDVLKDLKIK